MLRKGATGQVFLLLLMMPVLDGLSKNGVSSNRPEVLNIGVLLSLNSTVGKVARVAIEAAVEDLNSDPSVLGSTKLNLSLQDTNYSGFVGLVQALTLMEKGTLAIIGPQFSVTAHIITQLANELQVPLLSFSATDPTLSNLQNPFFVRTTQNDIFQMASIAEIIDFYGWREIITIYVDDDYGRNGIAALGDKLAERRCKILYKAPLMSTSSREDITNELVRIALMESRILVLLAYPESGLEVLDVARYLGMMGSGYVWILTDWLSTVLDTDSPLPWDAMDDIQGVITLRMYTPDTQQKRIFVSRWSDLVKRKTANTSSFGLNTYGLYAYDTVWLLAYAFDAFFNQGGEISFSLDPRLRGEDLQTDALRIFDGGKLLLHSTFGVNMSGLTGQLKFDPNGNRIRPAYEVINVIGTGSRRIGYWSNYSGLTIVPPETLYTNLSNRSSSSQQLYPVIWPGQTTTKPRGWVFPNNGKRLNIGVPRQNIFQEFVSVQGTDMFSGFCIDVFTAALNLLPYAVPYTFSAVGYDHTRLLELITAGVYDAAVGDIAITTNRTRMVDFTQPYTESGLVVVAPIKKRNSDAWAFLRPYTANMWSVTGLFFVIVGVVIWMLEHRVNDEFRGPPKRQVVTILWFSFSTLFFAHRQKTISGLGRVVLVVWLFVVFIVNSSYTASLTSILTVEQLASPIKGIESLVTSNDPIGYQRGSFAESYLTDEYNIDKSRLVPLGSAEEYAKALRDGPKKGGVAAVVDERAYMELFLSARCEFSIVGQDFSKLGWGFAFPRDSPLAVDMSTAILKLSEGGELQRIYNKWLLRSACTSEGAKENADRLQLKSFWGLFLVCGLACLLALIIHLVIVMKQFTELYKEELDSLSPSSPSKRLQVFLSFVSEKEEEVISRSKRRRTEGSSKRSIDSDELAISSFKSNYSASEV